MAGAASTRPTAGRRRQVGPGVTSTIYSAGRKSLPCVLNLVLGVPVPHSWPSPMGELIGLIALTCAHKVAVVRGLGENAWRFPLARQQVRGDRQQLEAALDVAKQQLGLDVRTLCAEPTIKVGSRRAGGGRWQWPARYPH